MQILLDAFSESEQAACILYLHTIVQWLCKYLLTWTVRSGAISRHHSADLHHSYMYFNTVVSRASYLSIIYSHELCCAHCNLQSTNLALPVSDSISIQLFTQGTFSCSKLCAEYSINVAILSTWDILRKSCCLTCEEVYIWLGHIGIGYKVKHIECDGVVKDDAESWKTAWNGTLPSMHNNM